jgi:hypothetical protein
VPTTLIIIKFQLERLLVFAVEPPRGVRLIPLAGFRRPNLGTLSSKPSSRSDRVRPPA